LQSGDGYPGGALEQVGHPVWIGGLHVVALVTLITLTA
jgi:hypothetical protein